jgi:replicative DNA helicase
VHRDRGARPHEQRHGNVVEHLCRLQGDEKIVLSQLNRELEKDKSRKPRLSDLRESVAIEQDADLIALLYKPDEGKEEDDAQPQDTDAIPVNLLIAKQRNGPTGDVHLTFFKGFTRFESAAKVADVPV